MFLILLQAGGAVWAGDQNNYHWRLFTAADGLANNQATAVTLSPRGNVWVKHGEAERISVWNGYSFNTLDSPGHDSFRVYESRGGQLWSLTPSGIALYDEGVWVSYEVDEIRREIQGDPLRRIRQIPLAPSGQDRVLFLLSDRLMEFNAAARTTSVLRRVTETDLGRFSEMTETQDGGIWISGARGAAKIGGPVRQISAETGWRQVLLGGEMPLENLQRPFENPSGGFTTVAAHAATNGLRVVVKWDGAGWEYQPLPGDLARQAWSGLDETLWAHTINALLRLEDGARARLTRERIWVGQFKDVAADTNGVFWLATSEGLLHCAPLLWRTPAGGPLLDGLVHAAVEDAEGTLWFATTDSLVSWGRGRNGGQGKGKEQEQDQEQEQGKGQERGRGGWRVVRWPEGFEANFHNTDGLYALPGGRVVVGAAETPLIYDAKTGAFRYVAHPDGRRVRFVGQAGAEAVAAQTTDANGAGKYALEQFDGETFTPFLPLAREWAADVELFFVTRAGDGDIWLGGSAGIGLVRGGEFKVFGAEEGFAAERALCLLEMGGGRVWCGGTDQILEFNGTRWTLVRAGLDRVNGMSKGKEGKVWAATNRGVYGHQDGVWVLHGEEEGLPSAGVLEVLQDGAGRIWAGTTRGLALYHPEADTAPPRTLAPVFEGEGGSKAFTDEEATLLFRAADKWHLTVPERLLFSYRLNESPWTPYTNLLSKTFENLRPGKHRLEVRAMDRNWNEDRQGAMIEFAIVVPWFRDSRVIAVSVSGLILVVMFAAIAVNRHLRLIRSYAEVERIVAERTEELERANRELLHSQKMKALGTLAAGIAHDFGNILSIIKGSAQIIEKNFDNKEKVQTRVSRIKSVVDQGTGIVRSMLGMSRTTERDYAPCDPNEVVEHTTKMLADRFMGEVQITTELASGLPRVLAAPELLQQILVNLVLNAADAISDAGEVAIRTAQLETAPSHPALAPAHAPGYVGIAVADSGSGISPEVLPRIFEPFFTTKAFSARRGTGLGLSMVYELAKEMGFGLAVESEAGKGSTFWILIPVRT